MKRIHAVSMALLSLLVPLASQKQVKEGALEQGKKAGGPQAYRALVDSYIKVKLESSPKDRPAAKFVPRFLELAKQHVGNPVEAQCLLWVILNGREQHHIASAAKGLKERHIDSEAMWVTMLNWFRLMRAGRDDMDATIQAVIDKSTNRKAIAEAHWASTRLNRDAKHAAAVEALLRKEFPESTPVLRYDGPAFKKKHLQIGMQAPDIVGEDVDGVEFKLSDYRGKVVLLDFWGDW